MRSKIFHIGMAVLWAITGGIPFVSGTRALAQNAKEKVLHNFDTNKSDGLSPFGGLIFDAAGNLYGTTTGSRGGFGTVFELTPSVSGYWTETILHNFSYSDGVHPSGTLVFDAAGNLYGTTIGGGSGIGTGCSIRIGGCGTVFELSPSGGGGWTESVLFNFDHSDGANPYAGLVFDAAGNLYGTTMFGGGDTSAYQGTVFELSPTTGGGWTHTVVHNFKENSGDGAKPSGSLIFDAAGNLYGTTVAGGDDFGTVFELSPQAGGGWKEAILYEFGGDNGIEPNSGLIFDTVGNLYGTTQFGGVGGGGTVFELSPISGGGWVETELYNFSNQKNQYVAAGSLIFDTAGNLYGATEGGGGNCEDGCGAIFKLTNSGGIWTETVLHFFDGEDGDSPYGSLIFDAAGNLYGTTMQGGTKDYGTAFEIAP
jgi:uncharacterized repeat protein (TIGR03803 family)